MAGRLKSLAGISAGLDLSVGSVIGFTTVLVALSIERLGIPPLYALGGSRVTTELMGIPVGSMTAAEAAMNAESGDRP
jgi:ribose/xylose/arabinose/galactoside ABC-type transport system permease subunit